MRLFRASTAAVPAGAPRPSMTLWYDPAGMRPPVSWVPQSGEFQTHWDWTLTDALAIPGYWRARMLISNSIGAMPLAAWKGNQQRTPTPPLLVEPNLGEDRVTTMAAWVADLVDHGNAVGYVTVWDNETGLPQHVQPWPAAATTVGRDPDTGEVVYKFHGNGGYVERPRSQVFHAKGVLRSPGDLRGLGVLEAGMGSLDRMAAESAYASRAFQSGVPSGLLRVKDPDLQPGDPGDPAGYATARGIKRSWQESIETGGVAVLSDLVDFQPLGWTPSDAQLVEARQFSLADIANLFNLDPYWVSSSQVSAPYQNVQDAAVQLSRFTLSYWIAVLEAQFSRALVRGTEARFNRDTILRDTQTVRVANWVAMLGAGIVTVDEVRAQEGMPPLPGAPGPSAQVVPFPAQGDQAANEAMGG